MVRRLFIALVVVVAVALAGLWVLGSGWLGSHWGPGEVTEARVPDAVIAERARTQDVATVSLEAPEPKQILFGDLHVHTTYSVDAFLQNLPLANGEGAHPVADACDYARFCSGLDFWSINDHAEALTPRFWRETVETMRRCNEVAGDPESPDVTAFLGWEWTQIGSTPQNHYGHKNVILRHLDDDRIPARPIAATVAGTGQLTPSTLRLGLIPLFGRTQASLDMTTYFQELGSAGFCEEGVPVRDLPTDCREAAATPGELFAKLDDWGHEAVVIPHGTTWGYYTPQGSSWKKQLSAEQHDPERQTLIEVFSGHGNSEEYRDWNEVLLAEDGTATCPEPVEGFLPSCWRAGEIIRARCLEAAESEDACEERAAEARQLYVDGDVYGHLTVPGVEVEEWLDSGQCSDCFQPSFNYRPKSAVQYIMALGKSADAEGPKRFRFGFIASSDNHSARPGTGFKEVNRISNTEARFGWLGQSVLGGPPDERPPGPRAEPLNTEGRSFFGLRETERGSSFFLAGGLVAVHVNGRDRSAIWEAMQRREVYGTSGPRILLWFDLVNAPGGERLPMGSEARMDEAPRFEVRAAGSLEQKPGCPDYASGALAPERLFHLCRGECYHPGDRRRTIARVEVVRIRPQKSRGEPIAPLIEDPWRTFPCPPDPEGCRVAFDDPELTRDTVYYVRAIEKPTLAINADALRCTRDADGRCAQVDPCGPEQALDDDCLARTEERAWSSPIFVDVASAKQE